MRLPDTPTIYFLTVEGRLKDKWADWLNGAVIKIKNTADNPDTTTIIVDVPDQAALRGILNKLWDLNLTLVSAILQENSANTGESDEY